ncbi:MAG: hypothetical protein VX519_09230 [Myxococcota bacterium]|nr:hypothetical protein [Myxococcota bacterium]
MSIWERLRNASDASRRRIKSIAREAMDGVDDIESRALGNSTTAQARALVQGRPLPPVRPPSFSVNMDLHVSAPSVAEREVEKAPTVSLDWVGPPAPEFPPGAEFHDESVPSRCFPNSMGFSDEEVETLLRVEHYPRLSGLNVEVLYGLACLEGRLLSASEDAGRAWVDLIANLVDQEEIWEEALYFTGAHHDTGLLEATEALGDTPVCEDYRAVGYSLLPFAEELVGASVGARDPLGFRDALGRMVSGFEGRRELACSNEGTGLVEEVEGLPMKARGVFAFRGFVWLDS